MKSFATQEELQLKNRFFTDSIPLSFRYGDRQIRGIPQDFQILENHCNTLVAADEKGLQIRVERTEYEDFPAAEWLVFFTNTGNEPTPVISDIRVGGVLPVEVDTLCHGNGDTHTYGCYKWFTTPLTDNPALSPKDGTSCNGAFPYMRLLGKNLGMNVAVGWTGKWHASFRAVEGGVELYVKQARCSMRILPGETIRTPRLTLVAYLGNEDRGRNMWRRWYFKYIMPPVEPMCCMHYYNQGGHPEWTGADEQGQLQAFVRYLEKGIRPDVWWMDAGWYPCDYNWRETGDWRPDPVRFPNGLAPIGRKCDETGIKYLLWFEPERIVENSRFALEHPRWILRTPVEGERQPGNLLVNLGDPECWEYVVNMLDQQIKDSGAHIYRQDFNFDPYPRWVDHEAPDRIGALENLHIQGYYRMWDALLERNPGLIIDSCASGGRRNDLETMRRSITLHYTDVGYGIHPTKQLQHRQMFEWIPYFRAHVWSWDHPATGEYGLKAADSYPRKADKYAFYVALTPSITDMLSYDDDDQLYELSRKMQPIWRKAARLMLTCDYYPLTECRESREDFYAMAFYDPDSGIGFLNVVSNNCNPERVFAAKLTMLEQDAAYTLTEAETGKTKTYSGKDLATGLPVELPSRSGVIYFIQRA